MAANIAPGYGSQKSEMYTFGNILVCFSHKSNPVWYRSTLKCFNDLTESYIRYLLFVIMFQIQDGRQFGC